MEDNLTLIDERLKFGGAIMIIELLSYKHSWLLKSINAHIKGGVNPVFCDVMKSEV